MVQILSRVQHILVLVNAPKAHKRANLSLRLENKLRHQTSRTSIDMVHISRIYLDIQTQNKAELCIYGVEILWV